MKKSLLIIALSGQIAYGDVVVIDPGTPLPVNAIATPTTSYQVINGQIQVISDEQLITQIYTPDQLASEIDSTQSEINNFSVVSVNAAKNRMAYLKSHLAQLQAMQQSLVTQ